MKKRFIKFQNTYVIIIEFKYSDNIWTIFQSIQITRGDS